MENFKPADSTRMSWWTMTQTPRHQLNRAKLDGLALRAIWFGSLGIVIHPAFRTEISEYCFCFFVGATIFLWKSTFSETFGPQTAICPFWPNIWFQVSNNSLSISLGLFEVNKIVKRNTQSLLSNSDPTAGLPIARCTDANSNIHPWRYRWLLVLVDWIYGCPSILLR